MSDRDALLLIAAAAADDIAERENPAPDKGVRASVNENPRWRFARLRLRRRSDGQVALERWGLDCPVGGVFVP